VQFLPEYISAHDNDLSHAIAALDPHGSLCYRLLDIGDTELSACLAQVSLE
jgi:hypothetical protein